VSFVIVPTPNSKKGAFSLQYAGRAFKEIGSAIAEKKTYHLVVLTSTLLPGSTRYGLLPLLEKDSGKKCGQDFGLCYSPEFIALGSIINDFLNPDFTLIGEFDERSGRLLEECYARIMLNKPPCKRMSIENAELTKIALNTFVTTKITYANFLAELCERIPGGDVDVVTDAIGADSRIGHKYFTGALGYGGPCFPKDNAALSFIANKLGINPAIPETTHHKNKAMVESIINRLRPDLDHWKTVAVLGLAYKPYSHVVEESQGLLIAQALAKAGVRVVAYDPLASNSAPAELHGQVIILDSLHACLDQADTFLITTPDPEFKALSAADFDNRQITVVDFWRILKTKLTDQPNIRYIPIGQSVNDHENTKLLAKVWNEISAGEF
jgi:UDPglucose 6-dehydrogenase